MDQAERIERIVRMEEKMDAVLSAAAELERALAGWKEARPDLEELRAYYDGELWISDFRADEAGLLPEDLKRGVLSEDGLFDLLEQARDLDEALILIPDKK